MEGRDIISILGIIIITGLYSSAFTDVSVTEFEMNKAVKICETNQGLAKYSKELFGEQTIICKNGAEFKYYTTKEDNN